MDLILSGAVTNRRKRVFAGKSVACYAMGSKDLLAWLDQNPFVEFQPMEKVFDPIYIGRNPSFVTVLSARKVDLSGRIALYQGKGNVTAGPGEARDFVNGAELSQNGMTIFALPSRNRQEESNILLSVENEPNLFNLAEPLHIVVTEYNQTYLRGRSVRERAMALIDIAHPEDRLSLVEQAKQEKLLYQDQLYLEGAGKLYPDTMVTEKEFKGGLTVRFRPIKPSDEDGMRRLFYRFSDRAVYYRYFTTIKAQPHNRMQEYVNVDFDQAMSIVGLVGPPGQGEIIAEARYVKYQDANWGDVAFLVDEHYQGLGIGTYMFQLLIQAARERCLRGFTADVLVENKAMLRVFEKGSPKVKVNMEHGIYSVSIPLETDSTCVLDDPREERSKAWLYNDDLRFYSGI
jgi:RimJ/RimL family protein N-acetyltransferase